MRKLTLDEKISIKGEFCTKGVMPRTLVNLTAGDATYIYWCLFGKPVSTHGSPKAWRNTLRRQHVNH
jgi:hypothetical protein